MLEGGVFLPFHEKNRLQQQKRVRREGKAENNVQLRLTEVQKKLSKLAYNRKNIFSPIRFFTVLSFFIFFNVSISDIENKRSPRRSSRS